MPVPEMGWQVAPPHWASPARRDLRSTDGEQIRAQYFEPLEASERAHWGAAVTESGRSEGHLLVTPVQAGEHTAPSTPWIWMATSSDRQPL